MGQPMAQWDEIFDPLHEARDHRGFRKCQDLAEAVEAFRRFVDWDHELPRYHATETGFAEIATEEEFNYLVHVNRISIQRHLAGKNLACWCTEDGCCHADVLLEIANDP